MSLLADERDDNVSDRDEDFFYQYRQFEFNPELYFMSANVPELSDYYVSNKLISSVYVAESVIDQVVSKVEKIIQERQIASAIQPFAIDRSFRLLDRLLNSEFYECDTAMYGNSSMFVCDEEPVQKMIPKLHQTLIFQKQFIFSSSKKMAQIDNWKRFTMPVDYVPLSPQQKLEQLTQLSETQHTLKAHTGKNLFGLFLKNAGNPQSIKGSEQKDSIKTTPQEEIIQQNIYFSTEVDYDQDEQILRQKQALEIREQQESEHNQQLAEDVRNSILQQKLSITPQYIITKTQKLKKQQREMHQSHLNQQFTYDYQGEVIYVKPINSDRMPPSKYSVNFNLTVNQNNHSSLLKQDSGILQSSTQKGDFRHSLNHQSSLNSENFGKHHHPNNNPPSQNQDKGVQFLPSSFEEFEPKEGVRLILQDQIKGGSILSVETERIAELEAKLRKPVKDSSIHMTQAQYNLIVKKGNHTPLIHTPRTSITRENIFGIDQNREQTPKRVTTSESPLQIINQARHQIVSKTHSDATSQYFNSKRFFYRNQSPQEKVKVAATHKFLENMISRGGSYGEYELESSQQNLPKLEKKNATIRSPTQIFNDSILSDDDWGKSKDGNNVLKNLTPQSNTRGPHLKDLKNSLPQVYKLPRERDITHGSQVIKSIKEQNQDSILQFRGEYFSENQKINDILKGDQQKQVNY